MYRIAAFTTDWTYEVSVRFLQGIARFLKEEKDTSFYVFDCFGKFESSQSEKGEYQIFRLPQQSSFDGALIQGNMILNDMRRQEVANILKARKIPTISIQYPIHGLPSLVTDSYSAMRGLVTHVIEAHGVKRLAYLTGFEESEEEQERNRGFLDACHEHQIPDSDIRIIPGLWEYEHGENAAHIIVEEKTWKPDALICANDDMALGAVETFHHVGVRVPEDLIVTGFDNTISAQAHNPSITTIEREYEESTYRGAAMLHEMLRTGRMLEPGLYYSPYSLVEAESCGCALETERTFRKIRSRYFQMDQITKFYYAQEQQMAAEMFGAESYQELFDIFEKHAGMFQCRNVGLFLNRPLEELGEGAPRRNPKDSRILMVAAQDARGLHRDDHHVYCTFERRELLPEAFSKDPDSYIFYPLHYEADCFGYICFQGMSPAMEFNLLSGTFRFIEACIENIHKKYLLSGLNERLDSLYVSDQLTGVYNRFGYDKYAGEVYSDLMLHEGADVTFVDMDNMKKINDRFGHETGDDAIRASAQVLRRSIGGMRKAFLMRYGGDEFMIICPQGADIETRIQNEVDRENASHAHPFTLSLSVGCVHAGEAGGSLADAVTMADQRMYEMKKARKMERS